MWCTYMVSIGMWMKNVCETDRQFGVCVCVWVNLRLARSWLICILHSEQQYQQHNMVIMMIDKCLPNIRFFIIPDSLSVLDPFQRLRLSFFISLFTCLVDVTTAVVLRSSRGPFHTVVQLVLILELNLFCTSKNRWLGGGIILTHKRYCFFFSFTVLL